MIANNVGLMAHLPEPREPAARALDPIAEQPLSEDDAGDADPVVRGPKNLVELPAVLTYTGPMLVRVGAASALVGSGLAVAGLVVMLGVMKFQSEQMQANQLRRDAGLGASGQSGNTFAMTLGALGALGPSDGGAAVLPDGATGLTAVVSPSEQQSPEGWVSSQQRLGRGHTLPQVLRALRVSSALSSNVIRAMRVLINMRSLQPSDVVVVQRESAGAQAVRKVEYRRGENEVIAVAVEDERRHAAGVVRRSRLAR